MEVGSGSLYARKASVLLRPSPPLVAPPRSLAWAVGRVGVHPGHLLRREPILDLIVCA